MSEADPPPQQVEEKAPPTQPPPAQVKSKPAPAAPAAAAPEFRVVKQGFVQRRGYLWNSWYRQWMTLDEDGVALRWYKTEQRTGNDGTLYMSKCAEVCDPREDITTNWPADVEGRCFVICSPKRAHYIIADSAEDKKEWVEKLTEARNKFSSSDVKIVSVNLFSVEAVKVSIGAEFERAKGEINKALASEGTSTDQLEKDLDKAADDVQKEVKKETETQQVVEKVETEVKVEAAATEEKGVSVSGDGGGEGVMVEVEVSAGDGEGVQVVTTGEGVTAAKKEDPPEEDAAGKEE